MADDVLMEEGDADEEMVPGEEELGDDLPKEDETQDDEGGDENY